MIILHDKDKNYTMKFIFPNQFFYAQQFDVKENTKNGSPIVDIVAENENAIYFIEAKNFVNYSPDIGKQELMDKQQNDSINELRNSVNYAHKIIRKLEHSLFVWIADKNNIAKPVYMVLAFNMPSGFKSRERLRLIDRLNGYLPSGVVNSGIIFDMPELENIRYGFTVSLIT